MPPSSQSEVDAVQDLRLRRRTRADCGPAGAPPSVGRPEIGADHVGVAAAPRPACRRRSCGRNPAPPPGPTRVITRFMWCSTSRMVSSSSIADAQDQLAQLADLLVVQAAAGSSSSSSFGLAASARASSTRFWVPNGRSATTRPPTDSRLEQRGELGGSVLQPPALPAARSGSAQRVGEKAAARAAMAADHDVVEHASWCGTARGSGTCGRCRARRSDAPDSVSAIGPRTGSRLRRSGRGATDN